MPDVSYHGENAWQIQNEVSSRQLGVLYSGSGTGGSDCFAAYNMHWVPHAYALPSPGKGKAWCMAVCTADGNLEQPELLENQKEIVLRERSIALLVSVKDERKNEKPSGRQAKGGKKPVQAAVQIEKETDASDEKTEKERKGS